ncbi:hypothetical protein AGABI2DRAFT_153030 [Agaricus bisporus var. bisporus H97]|uniref:hypothetical protein n=1 Tax=Agaricus bisporus var. bisporus (strain H97 / ATCC MYA-4626 / FGSC 10389) TaxID=936046 RepID=UPI00029F7ADA|nr:hypothetical protein AGABI2DRAFT_153030 [Agaricus bisporus var. bisporus H97]EKV44717.1 hypothetical protein AGABI2DRAFT_153030 [Agaricus bisporus var. bisporus H97]
MSYGIALVTGASRGIGRAIALRLAVDGYDIVLNDLPVEKENLGSVAEEIMKLGRRVLECIADVTKEDQVMHMIEKVEEIFEGLDVMVANAGICIPRPFLESTSEDWDRSFDVNGKGVYLCYKHAAKQMIKQGRGGRIIGRPLLSIYSATKFVVRSLTESAAIELGKYGITVNAYAPGQICEHTLE